MNIEYKTIKEIEKQQLQDLFLANKWDSGNYPDKLQVAIRNSAAVYTAWDGDKLIGLINVISDGIMNAYLHYVLVHPDYQGHGIASKLIKMFLEEHKNYMRRVIISYPESISFYEKNGFKDSGTKNTLKIDDEDIAESVYVYDIN